MQDIVPFGNHPLFRRTLGWMFPPKVSSYTSWSTAEPIQIVSLMPSTNTDLVSEGYSD